jgi:hypothetical protein
MDEVISSSISYFIEVPGFQHDVFITVAPAFSHSCNRAVLVRPE